MTAIARAEKLFETHIKNRRFIGDLILYLRHGFVVTHPNLFAMGRPVRRGAVFQSAIERPDARFVQPDTWYIAQVDGDLHRLLQLLPYALPWICFRRKFWSPLRFYRTADLIRHSEFRI